MVDEMTISSWKLRTTESLELKELARREQAFDPAWGLSESKLQLPIDVHAFPLDHTWNCEKLVVRALARDDHSSVSGTRQPGLIQNQWAHHIKEESGHQNRQGGNLEVEAVLGSTFENLSRYGRGLRNNLYRAMNQLRALRDEGQEK